jgi:peptide chain release factor 3
LLEGAGAAFDPAAMLRGDVSPVFFGSAMTNFGVELFLERFVRMGPAPSARLDAARVPIEPTDERFSAFVFKIQANMDPRHRDRVAFARICSGRFERDMTVRNVRTGKDVRLTRAMKLFANERESVDVAYAGDVVGLANPGTFAIATRSPTRPKCVSIRSRRSSRNILRRCAVSTPRVTSRSRRGSPSCVKRARFKCSTRSAKRGSNRSSPRSARCSSRS